MATTFAASLRFSLSASLVLLLFLSLARSPTYGWSDIFFPFQTLRDVAGSVRHHESVPRYTFDSEKLDSVAFNQHGGSVLFIIFHTASVPVPLVIQAWLS